MKRVSFFITAILIIVFIAYFSGTLNFITLKENFAGVAYGIVFLLLISLTLTMNQTWQKLKYFIIWVLIFFTLLIGYSYRHELYKIKERVLAELIPQRGLQKTPNSMSFPVSSDGHFYIRATINDVNVLFLVDTGASKIVLTPHIAQKLGFNLNKLKFNQVFETANGLVRGSYVELANFKIGNFILKNIGASINAVSMQSSLLGMTFFKRLKSYEVKDGVLTLYW